MIIFLSIILGLVVGVVIGALALRFEESMRWAVIKSVIAGVLIMISNIIVSKIPAILALMVTLVLFAMMGYLVYWWKKQGSNFKELMLISLADMLIALVAKAGAVRIRDLISTGWLIATIESLPLLIFVLSITFFIADAVWFRIKLEEVG